MIQKGKSMFTFSEGKKAEGKAEYEKFAWRQRC